MELKPKKVMKNLLFVILIAVIISSCSKDYTYDELDYNLFAGKGRTNSYEQFGNFPLQIINSSKIISTDSSGIIQAPLRLKSPFTIVTNNRGNVLRINNTTVDRFFDIDSNFVAATGLTADRNSNIYFISSNDEIYSINSELKLKWKKEIPIPKSRALTYSDLLSVDDGIILGASSGDIIKYDFSGNQVWHYKSNLAVGNTFSGDAEGNIYLPLTNNLFGTTDSILCLAQNGKSLWQIPLENTRILSPAACRNGKIYVTGAKENNAERNGITYCLDKAGKILWKTESTLPGRNVSVDYEGNCYITGISSGVGEISTGIFAFDTKGKEIWKIYFGADAVSPLIISEKYLGFTAFTGEGAAMFFLRKTDGMLVRSHSMSNYPPLYLQPLVNDDASIRLFGANKLIQIKFSETTLEKYLP